MNFQFKNFESIKTIMPVLSFYNLKKENTLVVLNSNLQWLHLYSSDICFQILCI